MNAPKAKLPWVGTGGGTGPKPKLLWIVGNKGPTRLYLGNVVAKEELLAALELCGGDLSPAFKRFRDLLRSNVEIENAIIERSKLRKAGLLKDEPEAELEAEDA